jgi:hypothetical protein
MDQNENIFDAFNEDEDENMTLNESYVGKKHKREQELHKNSHNKKQKLKYLNIILVYKEIKMML